MQICFKKHACLSKMKCGSKTNSNWLNSMWMFKFLKDDILNVFSIQQRCFARSNNHRCKMLSTISAVSWRTVHEHIVADTFRSKKSSSALFVHEQQASQKRYLSSYHSTLLVFSNITFVFTTSNWMMNGGWLERHHFFDACCSWIRSADKLFLDS